MANIVETAINAGQFNTLCKALELAGLVDALQTGGPWTVFAPTDQAFSQLSRDQINELLQDVPRLKQVLLYHVVDGDYLAEDVVENEQIESVQGENITIDASRDGVMVNEANVIESDIETDNGVIHVIDSVIMPKAAVML